MDVEDILDEAPNIAILRGVVPERVVEVSQAIVAAGIRIVEVPLNSPDPFKSIGRLASILDAACVCGAGTVLTRDDVDRAYEAGARLIVSPNTDAAVIERALTHEMSVMPGFATATEALLAIKAGATRLKLFPASSYGAGHLKALTAVLPRTVRVYAVGGIGAREVDVWIAAGAAGFGFGSELFKPGYTIEDISARGKLLVEATRRAKIETARNK